MSIDQAETKCPSPETIVRYVLGILSTEKEYEVEIHLDDCNHCRLEAVTLGESLEAFQGKMGGCVPLPSRSIVNKEEPS